MQFQSFLKQPRSSRRLRIAGALALATVLLMLAPPSQAAPAVAAVAACQGDFDLDGADDLVVFKSDGELIVYPSPETDDVRPLLHQSLDLPLRATTGACALGDLDGDGRPDLVLSFRPRLGGASDLRLLIQRDSEGFVDATETAGLPAHQVLRSLSDVTLRDYDGDGTADLVGLTAGRSMVVLRNDGSGVLDDPTTFETPSPESWEGPGAGGETFGSLAAAASSTDFVGPCTGEQSVFGSPAYLSVDAFFPTTRKDWTAFGLTQPGRFKLGISCTSTGYVVARLGDSALCDRVRQAHGVGFDVCTSAAALAFETTRSDIEAVMSNPRNVPFTHSCTKHGFGWYDAVNVPAGSYLALAVATDNGSLWVGHGTMDTYAFIGNNGNYQPVGCSTTPTGGGGGDDPGPKRR